MAVSVLAEALVRWQHAAGPFWPYVCAAPFLGTGEGETLAKALPANGSRGLSRRDVALAERLLGAAESLRTAADLPLSRGRERGPGGRGDQGASWWDEEGLLPTVLLVDLPPEPVLAVAPLLVARGWYVVPVVQRWIANPAVLPCRRLVERLVAGAWRAARPTIPRGAVFIADGERTGPAGYPPLARGRTFDNRYEYQICRFPSLAFLKHQHVERVGWITARPNGQVAPDLLPYQEALLQTGISVDVVPWETAPHPRRSRG